jgi:hypothetical protein
MRVIIKIRSKINEIETKSWIFEKISNIDRPLANMIKIWRKKKQISKIRNAKGETRVPTIPTPIK